MRRRKPYMKLTNLDPYLYTPEELERRRLWNIEYMREYRERREQLYREQMVQ